MKRSFLICFGMVLVSVLLVFPGCDLMGEEKDGEEDGEEDESDDVLDYVTQSRGISVSGPGGGMIPHGSTIKYDYLDGDNADAYSDFQFGPYAQKVFTIRNAGEVEIGFWGIHDITEPDFANYHDGEISLQYADQTSSFELSPEEEYTFDLIGEGSYTAGDKVIVIAIHNKNDITPNPYILRVFVDTP